ncbi:hypothetical protein ACOSQ3_027646 [Xanthoceras sorbifolium]
MSIIFSLFVFFSCLSMNACNARRFGVINIHKGSSTQFHFSTKVVEKFKELDQNINVEGTNGSGNIVDKSHGNEKITQESPGNYTKALSDRQKMMKHAVSGNASHVGLLKATNIEDGSRRRGLIVTSSSSVTNFNKNKNKAEDDVVAVLDYEPPHQRPPSHNKQT